MRDLEELRDRDIKSGHFDMYVDDVNFTDFQFTTLAEKDILRISEINRDDIKDETIFEKLKETSDFLKEVLNKISNGEGRVMFEGIRPFADKIIEYVEKDVSCLKKLDDKTFCHEDLLEAILSRKIMIEFNKIEKLTENEITDEVVNRYEKFKKIYDAMMDVVNRYRNII